MEFKEYLELSEVTEKKFEDGMELSVEQASVTNEIINAIISIGKDADLLKKHLIYGKEIEAFDAGAKKEVKLNSENAEYLHHILGVLTESTELFEALLESLEHEKPIDVVNVQEEIGDLFWYIAGLLRLTGADPYKIMEQNIEKLKARYGEKFDAHAALNRDLDNEREVLENNNASEV